jgi:tRNA pseudouridine38-40 synthase
MTTNTPGTSDGAGRIRVRLDVAYDGTEFSGWAVQPDRRTVAGTLLGALDRLGVGAANLTVAGRTDAGVHATGQVCHIDLTGAMWERLAGAPPVGTAPTLLRRLAGLLPVDLRVLAAVRVPAEFDARFSALSRRYEYRVTDSAWGAAPLQARYTLAWPRPLDLAALQDAARGLLGEHDFAAYCKRKEHATTVRAVSRLDWQRAADGVLIATVQADAFCQAMVRSLVGALLAVGDGRRPVPWPGGLLTRTERSSEVMVVPAHGLTLVEVRYPDDPAGYASRAQLTRARRALG